MRQPGRTQKLSADQIAEIQRLGATKMLSYDGIARRIYQEHGVSISLTRVRELLKGKDKQ